MKVQAFLIFVGEMRAAQSKYYRERTHSNLIAAKELERKVDAVIKQGRLEPDDLPAEPKQVNLFVTEDGNEH